MDFSLESIENKYENDPSAILLLSSDCHKVVYANVMAITSLGCLSDGTDITRYLREGWEREVKRAREQLTAVFIPFRDQSIFTYLKITPVRKSRTEIMFLANVIYSGGSLICAGDLRTYDAAKDQFAELFTVLETAEEKYPSGAAADIIGRLKKNAVKIYNYCKEQSDFVYRMSREERSGQSVFSLLSVMQLVNKTTSAIEIDAHTEKRMAAVYLKSNFNLLLLILEEMTHFLLSQTKDTSPITSRIEVNGTTAILTMFKRGFRANGGTGKLNNELFEDPESMIQIMGQVLDMLDLQLDFSTSEDAISATVTINGILKKPAELSAKEALSSTK